jgi:N-acyl amino acid synthase of PEP-CTERM/exosortase system
MEVLLASESRAPARRSPNSHEATQPDDLHKLYERHFTAIRAETEQLRTQFYRLRYQVYCVENPFEDPAQQDGEMEIDAFDAHSNCSLLVHRPTGLIAGGIRLILPFEAGEARQLPLWDVCSPDVLAQYARHLPVERTGEVSRNAISKQFRRMVATIGQGSAEDLQRIMRNLSLGLLGAVVRMAADEGITHVCAAMEAPMLRMFSRLGIHFQKLGPAVEFHGIRQPAYAEIDSLLARTWVERPDVWRLLTRDGRDWSPNRELTGASAGGWKAQAAT